MCKNNKFVSTVMNYTHRHYTFILRLGITYDSNTFYCKSFNYWFSVFCCNLNESDECIFRSLIFFVFKIFGCPIQFAKPFCSDSSYWNSQNILRGLPRIWPNDSIASTHSMENLKSHVYSRWVGLGYS